MVRSLASKLPSATTAASFGGKPLTGITDFVTGPIDQISRRIKLGPLGALREVPFNVRVLAEAGVIRPVRPDKLAAMAVLLSRWGASPAAGIAGAAVNHPDEPMIEDELGALTFAEVQARSNAIARGLAAGGVSEGDGVAIMCRNHRGFIEATLAASKLGANALYMNTAFSGPQLADVIEREKPEALVYDEEFSELLSKASEAGSQIGLSRYVAWSEDEHSSDKEDPTLAELIDQNSDEDLDPPDESSRFVILTSGTTGTPKGAQRAQPDTLSPLAAMFAKIPLHAREKTMIAAPLFHSWGFAHFVLGLALNSTYVLRRKFDPEETLKATQESGATALVVVPVMMQRILELPEETLDKYRLPNLRVTGASGSVLPGELANEWMDRFGENVYNLYGSTEVAWATIATPEDLRAAPGTAGRPPRGTVVRIVDEEGNDVRRARRDGCSSATRWPSRATRAAAARTSIGGLLSSGDVGHFDEEGRLFIDGRDDEMIVSGGENVFPREVEDLLADHDKVKEAAVIGVDDESSASA